MLQPSQTLTRQHTHAHTYTHIHTHTYLHTHTYTHKHTHTNTHTYTHKLSDSTMAVWSDRIVNIYKDLTPNSVKGSSFSYPVMGIRRIEKLIDDICVKSG